MKKPRVKRGSIDTNYRGKTGINATDDYHLRQRALELLAADAGDGTNNNARLIEAYYKIADAGPDADLDELFETIDPDLHERIGHSILGYTPRSQRPPAQVHVVELDGGLRKKILERGVPMFSIGGAAAAGTAVEPTRQPAEERNNGSL